MMMSQSPVRMGVVAILIVMAAGIATGPTALVSVADTLHITVDHYIQHKPTVEQLVTLVGGNWEDIRLVLNISIDGKGRFPVHHVHEASETFPSGLSYWWWRIVVSYCDASCGHCGMGVNPEDIIKMTASEWNNADIDLNKAANYQIWPDENPQQILDTRVDKVPRNTMDTVFSPAHLEDAIHLPGMTEGL